MKKYFTTFILLLTIYPLFAQLNFAWDNKYFLQSQLGYGNVFKDLDGDNLPDIISFRSNKGIYWLKNQNNQLTTLSYLDNSAYFNCVNAEDMNGDNANDIVALKTIYHDHVIIAKQVVLFQNNGLGQFTEHVLKSFTENNINVLVAVANIFSSHFPDILLSTKLNGEVPEIIIMRNLGDGTFQEMPSQKVPKVITGEYNCDFFITDLNNDGFQDIFVSNGYDFYLYKSDGLGHFTTKSLKLSFDLYYYLDKKFVQIADYNQDGYNDIFFVERNSMGGEESIIVVFKNLQDGTFGQQEVLIHDTIDNYLLGDFNNDGKVDVLYNRLNNSSFFWMKNNGDETFSAPVKISNNSGANVFTIIDFNNDGNLDIFIKSPSTGSHDYSVLFNDGNGNFTQTFLKVLQPNKYNHKAIPVYTDNPLQADILINGYYPTVSNNRGIFFIKNRGNYSFDLSNQIIRKNLQNFKLGDIDGDGNQDILGYYFYPDSLFWFKNDGTFHFTEQPPVTNTFKSSSYFDLKDVTGNGLPDIVSEYYDNDSSGDLLHCIFNTGGVFNNPQLISRTIMNSFLVEDFNNDGVNEIICRVTDNKTVIFYYNGSHFDKKLLTDMPVVNLKVQDFNADSLRDIVVTYYKYPGTNNYEKAMGWFKNRGNLTFDSLRIIDDSLNVSVSYNLRILDWNRDGLPDIILEDRYYDNNILYLNNGDGNFKPRIEDVVDWLSENTYFADMDGDGDKDAFSWSDFYGKYYILENFTDSKTEQYNNICEGDSILFLSGWLKNTGLYCDTLRTVYGGDSIIYLHLTVEPDTISNLFINGEQTVNEMDTADYLISGSDALYYSWNIDNGIRMPSLHQQEAKIQWQTPGTGTINVDVFDPRTHCKSQSSLMVTIDRIPDSSLVVYPNPAGNKIRVTQTHEGITTEIYSQYGQLLIRSSAFEIDVSSLASGTYPVLLKNNDNHIVARKILVIQ
ncbi:MAG: hypothetical protein DRJ09_00610 [Bacteroidetes bacterium]|nr:MAG: hypothetical protein DRJ09_00610 [Bacteroidota bacterium]